MTTTLLRIVPLLLAAAVGVTVIDAGFVYDDPSALIENPVVNGAAPIWEAFEFLPGDAVPGRAAPRGPEEVTGVGWRVHEGRFASATSGLSVSRPPEGWRLALLTRDDHLAAATGLSMKKAAGLKNGGLPVGLFLYP